MANKPARSSNWKKWTAVLMLAAIAAASASSVNSQTPFSDIDQTGSSEMRSGWEERTVRTE